MENSTVRDLPAALIGWYPFTKNAKALYIISEQVFEVLFDVLAMKQLQVDQLKADEVSNCQVKYDYVVAVNVLERAADPVSLLNAIKNVLTDKGKLLLGVDNRFAVRYFCGDKDKYTGHVLDGIDNYRKVSKIRMDKIGGHAYSRAEILDFLQQAQFDKSEFYSVLPSLERPQMMLAYGYKPNEALDVRIFPQYHNAETVFMEEELIYDSLLDNDMLHQMANGYLIECSVNGELLDVDQITVQGDRERKEALATLIKKGQFVKKVALYEEAGAKIDAMFGNDEYLRKHGVPLVASKVEQDAYMMPYVDGEIATLYFRKVLRESKDKFLEMIYQWKNVIENSSEHVPYDEVDWFKFEPNWERRKPDDPNLYKWQELANGSNEDRSNIGVILKRGYIDMASLNCFHTEEGFRFFDQEFYIDNFPANAILIRTIDFIYRDTQEMECLLPREELLKELHLFEHQNTWRRKGNLFLEALRNEKQLLEYHRICRRDARVVQVNRHRMDYTQEEYDKLFQNIFKGIDNKKIYLFGSGNYAEEFVKQFQKDYEIAGILDNNPARWGEELSGIPVMSPDVLRKVEVPFKVFICIKFFDEVLMQLKQMGIKDISVYDPRLDYERPLKMNPAMAAGDEKPKKYHVGYIAGVFDLFHIGHLNMFRRAKEQCDYLIVGVVTDEQVIKNKKTSPYMSFAERLEIVQSCRYVDEAVEIPVDKPNTEDAYYRYHFDVQFSGSDYENDPEWLARRLFLQQHGSDLVFFPYTQSTSSTKLKTLIEKKI